MNLGQWDSWDILKKTDCPTENRWYIWQWDNWDGWDSVLGYGLSRFLSGRGKDDAHGKVNGIVNSVDLKKAVHPWRRAAFPLFADRRIARL